MTKTILNIHGEVVHAEKLCVSCAKKYFNSEPTNDWPQFVFFYNTCDVCNMDHPVFKVEDLDYTFNGEKLE